MTDNSERSQTPPTSKKHSPDERFWPGRTCRLKANGKFVELIRKLNGEGPRTLWEAKWVGTEVDPDCWGTTVREHELYPCTTAQDLHDTGIAG